MNCLFGVQEQPPIVFGGSDSSDIFSYFLLHVTFSETQEAKMDVNREKEHFLALKGKIFPCAHVENKF